MTTETTYVCKDCGHTNSAADTWLEPHGRNSVLGPPIPFCRDVRACLDRIAGLSDVHWNMLRGITDAERSALLVARRGGRGVRS